MLKNFPQFDENWFREGRFVFNEIQGEAAPPPLEGEPLPGEEGDEEPPPLDEDVQASLDDANTDIKIFISKIDATTLASNSLEEDSALPGGLENLDAEALTAARESLVGTQESLNDLAERRDSDLEPFIIATNEHLQTLTEEYQTEMDLIMDKYTEEMDAAYDFFTQLGDRTNQITKINGETFDENHQEALREVLEKAGINVQRGELNKVDALTTAYSQFITELGDSEPPRNLNRELLQDAVSMVIHKINPTAELEEGNLPTLEQDGELGSELDVDGEGFDETEAVSTEATLDISPRAQRFMEKRPEIDLSLTKVKFPNGESISSFSKNTRIEASMEKRHLKIVITDDEDIRTVFISPENEVKLDLTEYRQEDKSNYDPTHYDGMVFIDTDNDSEPDLLRWTSGSFQVIDNADKRFLETYQDHEIPLLKLSLDDILKKNFDPSVFEGKAYSAPAEAEPPPDDLDDAASLDGALGGELDGGELEAHSEPPPEALAPTPEAVVDFSLDVVEGMQNNGPLQVPDDYQKIPSENPELQEAIKAVFEGYDENASDAQNVYNFQAEYGLDKDYIAGPKTVRMINLLQSQKDLQAEMEEDFESAISRTLEKNETIDPSDSMISSNLINFAKDTDKYTVNFDPSTQAEYINNVKAFQETYGLVDDGVIGPKTAAMLNRLLDIGDMHDASQAIPDVEGEGEPDPDPDGQEELDDGGDELQEVVETVSNGSENVTFDARAKAFLVHWDVPGGEFSFARDSKNPDKLVMDVSDIPEGTRYGYRENGRGFDAKKFLEGRDVSRFKEVNVTALDADTLQITRVLQNGNTRVDYMTFPSPVPDGVLPPEGAYEFMEGELQAREALDNLMEAITADNGVEASTEALQAALTTEGVINEELANRLHLIEGLEFPVGETEIPEQIFVIQIIGGVVDVSVTPFDGTALDGGADDPGEQAESNNSANDARRNVERIKDNSELIAYFEANFPGITIVPNTEFLGAPEADDFDKDPSFGDVPDGKKAAQVRFTFMLRGEAHEIVATETGNIYNGARKKALSLAESKVQSAHIAAQREDFPDENFNKVIEDWIKNSRIDTNKEFPKRLAEPVTNLLKSIRGNAVNIQEISDFSITDGHPDDAPGKTAVTVSITFTRSDGEEIPLTAEGLAGTGWRARREAINNLIKKIDAYPSDEEATTADGDAVREQTEGYDGDAETFNTEQTLAKLEANAGEHIADKLEGDPTEAKKYLEKLSLDSIKNVPGNGVEFVHYTFETGGDVTARKVTIANGGINIYPAPADVAMPASLTTNGGTISGPDGGFYVATQPKKTPNEHKPASQYNTGKAYDWWKQEEGQALTGEKIWFHRETNQTGMTPEMALLMADTLISGDPIDDTLLRNSVTNRYDANGPLNFRLGGVQTINGQRTAAARSLLRGGSER
jgi:hypothetical protein